MNIILFFFVLIASFIIVRIGAIAFQLTGLEWSLAKFQSLSCFSGTGFTTKEAELITGDPQRRKIATVLMILGNAGLVTLIATVASAINPTHDFWETLSKSHLPFTIPGVLIPWINILIIGIVVIILFKLAGNRKAAAWLTRILRNIIIKKNYFAPIGFQELLLVADGYGVTQIHVTEGNPVLGKSLADSDLRKNDVSVLAIIRNGSPIPNPNADTVIQLNDELLAFGNLKNVKERICSH